jgi:hypothetical protein
MSALSIIAQRLLDSPEVTAIVGDKIFPIMAPQNAERPYLVLHIIDNMDTPILAGAGKYFRTQIQSDAYSEMTPAGAKQVIELGDAVIEALNGVVKEKIAGCVDVDILLGSADFTESALEANTHRRYTQFSVRWRTQPGAPAEPPIDPDNDDIAFSVTAAAGNGALGYAGSVHYAGWGPFGNISAEPIAGYPLQGVTRHPTFGSVIAFTGDVTAQVAGKSVWVNGVNYGPGVQYAWAYAAGVTIWSRITGGPVFVAGQVYSIEIK